MTSLRQRRQSSPNDVGRFLSAGDPGQLKGTGGGIRLAATTFFIASLVFMASSFGGNDDGHTSLRKRNDTSTHILVPGYTDASLKRYKKERRDAAIAKSELDPAEEHIWDSHELKKYFDCKRVLTKRPVIQDNEWRYFRDLYNEFIESEASQGRNETYKFGSRNIPTKVEGTMTPDKGRGLIASQNIAKGERIFTGTNNTIIYRTGRAWREFLLHLYYAPPLNDHYKDGFACDIMSWSWNQEVETSDGAVVAIVVDLDSSSLLNRPNDDQVLNIQCGELVEDRECGMDYFAVKDIQQGEEIICKYGDFSSPQWQSFGL